MFTAWLKYFSCFFLIKSFSSVYSQFQPISSVVFFDEKYLNEPFYFDLSYLNSNFTSYESLQNKFATKDRVGSSTSRHSCSTVKQIPANVRSELKLTYFYQKYTEAYGIPVIGSNKASSNGLRRACYVLRFYLANYPEARETFYKRNLRVVLMATSENLLNVPEYNSMPVLWNSVRGLSATKNIPLVTVAEENVLCTNDKLRAEDLLFHQFSYSLLNMNTLESNLKADLNNLYDKAKYLVPWKDTFSLLDVKEYFASSVDVLVLGKQGSFSLDDLRRYDPLLIDLIKKIFKCDNTYLTKCKSSREAENTQIIKEEGNCDSDNLNVSESSIESTLVLPSISTATLSSTPQTKLFRQNFNVEKNEITRPVFGRTTSFQSERDNSYFNTLSTTSRFSAMINREEVNSNGAFRNDDCENLNENCVTWALKGECSRNRQFMQIECKKSCNFCNGAITTRTTTKKLSTTEVDLSVFENFCKDDFTHCPVFALRGDCKTNPHHMLDKCKRSCNLCGDLVQQKDRIQPTSKKIPIRRPQNLFGFQDNIQRVKLDENNYESSSNSMPTKSYTRNQNQNQRQTYSYRTETTKDEHEEQSADTDCKDLAGHCFELAQRGDCEANKDTMKYYCSKSCRFC